jgi:hypothetical protein
MLIRLVYVLLIIIGKLFNLFMIVEFVTRVIELEFNFDQLIMTKVRCPITTMVL